jgi:hypothetical protein
MSQKLKFSAYAGIIYLISLFPEVVLNYIIEHQPTSEIISYLLFITYIICMLSTIFFYYGFIILGKNLNNNLLTVSSWIIILTSIFYYIFEMVTINLHGLEPDIAGISALFIFGFSGIVFGIGLLQNIPYLSKFALIAGILEMIIGFLCITVILFLFALILTIPATILEIFILLKASELIHQESNNKK